MTLDEVKKALRRGCCSDRLARESGCSMCCGALDALAEVERVFKERDDLAAQMTLMVPRYGEEMDVREMADGARGFLDAMRDSSVEVAVAWATFAAWFGDPPEVPPALMRPIAERDAARAERDELAAEVSRRGLLLLEAEEEIRRLRTALVDLAGAADATLEGSPYHRNTADTRLTHAIKRARAMVPA